MTDRELAQHIIASIPAGTVSTGQIYRACELICKTLDATLANRLLRDMIGEDGMRNLGLK